jgi:calcineurin-like phosphoesterase family protein
LKEGDLNSKGYWVSEEIATARLKEMNETIINNFNSMIKEDDMVIHNGDFVFKNSPGGKLGEGTTTRAYDYIKQLNGMWTFIMGNHDKQNSLKTKILNLTFKFGNYKFFIVHNPEHANLNYDINLCGHVHEKWKIKRKENTILYNVGVDVNQFKPVSFEKIIVDIERWKKLNEPTV